MLDFDAITSFWWGDLPEPKFPFEPISLEPLAFERLPEREERPAIEDEE